MFMIQAGVKLLAVIHVAAAHFTLKYPGSIGYDESTQDIPPCGGFQINYTHTTRLAIGGDSISVDTSEDGVTWLFRGTIDRAAGSGWANLLPAISQDSSGAYCAQFAVTAPKSFIGHLGVLQVIQKTSSGLKYQVYLHSDLIHLYLSLEED